MEEETDIPGPDVIEQFSLDQEQCSGSWSSDRSIKYNVTKKQVGFNDPRPIFVFDLDKNFTVQLGDDEKFGPTNYKDFTTLFVEVFGDTIFVQIDIQGLNTFESCRSHYVKS